MLSNNLGSFLALQLALMDDQCESLLLRELFSCLPGNLNPFVPNAPFLCPLKTSENREGVENGCVRNKRVNCCFISVPSLFWKSKHESSAYRYKLNSAAQLISLRWITSISESKIEACGTPHEIFAYFEAQFYNKVTFC